MKLDRCSVRRAKSKAWKVISAPRNVSNGIGYEGPSPLGASLYPYSCMSQATHKTKHKKQSNLLHHVITPKVISEPDPATGHFNPFPAYSYSGSLRPVYPLSTRRTIPDRIPHPEYAKDGVPRSEQVFVGRNKITILDKAQQEGMRKVCRLAREVLDIAAREAKPGVTTDHIDEVVHKACIERDVSVGRQHLIWMPADQHAVLPFPFELLQLPQISLYLGQ